MRRRSRSVPPESSVALNRRIGLNGAMLETEGAGDDSASCEKFILDFESYMDEVGNRLSVSRMVNDSVVKGMVSAVAEESAEKIASKDAEIASLNHRLQSCWLHTDGDDHLGSPVAVPSCLRLFQGFLETDAMLRYAEQLSKLRGAVEQELQGIKEDIKVLRGCPSPYNIGASHAYSEKLLETDQRVDGLMVLLESRFKQIGDMFSSTEASIADDQWENELQSEVSNILIQSYIRELKEEFEANLYEQREQVYILNRNWEEKVTELTALREELNAILKSLLSSELGVLHGLESSEDGVIMKRKDQLPAKPHGEGVAQIPSEENGSSTVEKFGISREVALDVADFLPPRHMSIEELITHFKSEMSNMRRQHDTALMEKTEELFRLKREFLKERGSAPFRKDRDFEHMRTRLPKVIAKLDEIVSSKVTFPLVSNDNDEVCRLKNQMDMLFYENQHIRSLLMDKKKEVKHLFLWISDVASKMSRHSTSEANLLSQIKKLKVELEDQKIAGIFKDTLYHTIWREIVNDFKLCMKDAEVQTVILEETFCTVFKVFLCETMCIASSTRREHFIRKEEFLLEKEKVLSMVNEENEELKQTITYLSTLMKEKEQLASEVGSALMRQKEDLDSVNYEVNMLRGHVDKQAEQILDYRKELDSVQRRLDEALQQVSQYEFDITKLTQRWKSASNALEEANRQNVLLRGVILEKEKTLLSYNAKDTQKENQLQCIGNSMSKLSKALAQFEDRLVESFKRNENRLLRINHQFNPLVKQVISLRRKELWYKQTLQIKCANLQKAEDEVDLLGDEVDALLSLLGKIYIALDHYSPVLQHYPGVMEILKLVQKELKGENF